MYCILFNRIVGSKVFIFPHTFDLHDSAIIEMVSWFLEKQALFAHPFESRLRLAPQSPITLRTVAFVNGGVFPGNDSRVLEFLGDGDTLAHVSYVAAPSPDQSTIARESYAFVWLKNSE